MKAIFRGVFEKVYDQAHCRLRLIAKQVQKTRALPGQEFEVGHIERSLFRAREPQAPVTAAEMRFGIWLGAWDENPSIGNISDKEFSHWRQFYETRIYGPTVEVIEVRESQSLDTQEAMALGSGYDPVRHSLNCGYEDRWNN